MCRTLAAVLVLLAATLLTGCGLFGPGQDRVAREFAAAWSRATIAPRPR